MKLLQHLNKYKNYIERPLNNILCYIMLLYNIDEI